jgi:acyl phosphate:glycerol-3-phosphate acyltransferase
MLLFVKTAFVLIAAYLLGSIPTTLIISTRIKHIDIRSIGDGNMGARNTFHQLSPKFGVRVAIIDFFQGRTTRFSCLYPWFESRLANASRYFRYFRP